MFDRDDHPAVDQLIESATKVGVRVRFSHPCFELWLVLHFRDYGAPAGGVCGPATDVVGEHLREYRRRGKRVTVDDLSGRYQTARSRAIRLNQQHDRDGLTVPTKRDPSTTVFELVDELAVDY